MALCGLFLIIISLFCCCCSLGGCKVLHLVVPCHWSVYCRSSPHDRPCHESGFLFQKSGSNSPPPSCPLSLSIVFFSLPFRRVNKNRRRCRHRLPILVALPFSFVLCYFPFFFSFRIIHLYGLTIRCRQKRGLPPPPPPSLPPPALPFTHHHLFHCYILARSAVV